MFATAKRGKATAGGGGALFTASAAAAAAASSPKWMRDKGVKFARLLQPDFGTPSTAGRRVNLDDIYTGNPVSFQQNNRWGGLESWSAPPVPPPQIKTQYRAMTALLISCCSDFRNGDDDDRAKPADSAGPPGSRYRQSAACAPRPRRATPGGSAVCHAALQAEASDSETLAQMGRLQCLCVHLRKQVSAPSPHHPFPFPPPPPPTLSPSPSPPIMRHAGQPQ
jgi:hypothetical protein